METRVARLLTNLLIWATMMPQGYALVYPNARKCYCPLRNPMGRGLYREVRGFVVGIPLKAETRVRTPYPLLELPRGKHHLTGGASLFQHPVHRPVVLNRHQEAIHCGI